MLKIATVFSGIGAIEHALQRMNVEHKIVFACDNGDVNIFEKKIPLSFIAVENEIRELEGIINRLDISIREDFEHINDLEEHLDRIREEFESLINDGINSNDINTTKLMNYLEISKIKNKEIDNIIKAYLLVQKQDIYGFDKNIIIELVLKEEEKIIEKKHKEEIKVRLNGEYEQHFGKLQQYAEFRFESDYKKKKKQLKEITDNLSMLHEKIETLHVHNDLSQIESYQEKKNYVDNLYKGKEKSNFVRQSYFANYDIKKEDFHWNVSFVDGTQYTNEIDLFVGGSPCQSFSMVGKQRGLQDTRGTLFYEYARLVKEIQPKVFIYENVRAVLSNDEGRTWETMQKVFEDVGYSWKLMVLNGKDYGIPQNRERIFVVGFRKDLKLAQEFEEPEKQELNKTMKDFLMDNVSGKYYLNQKGVQFVTKETNLLKKWTQIDGDIQLCQKKNQQFNWHGDFVFEEENIDREKTIQDLEKYFLSEKVRKYVLASGTGNFYSRPEIDLDIARPLLTTMHKMHRAGIDNYVTTDGRIRKLTPRECLRLMGFCDSFKIVVSDTQVYQQAGNSIIVNVLIAIMKSVFRSLPELEKGENYQYIAENTFNEVASDIY